MRLSHKCPGDVDAADPGDSHFQNHRPKRENVLRGSEVGSSVVGGFGGSLTSPRGLFPSLLSVLAPSWRQDGLLQFQASRPDQVTLREEEGLWGFLFRVFKNNNNKEALLVLGFEIIGG